MHLESTVENNVNFFKRLAKKIKIALEEDGKEEKEEVWNIIAGTDFGAWICFDKTYVIYFRLEDIYFLMFRFGTSGDGR